MCCRVHFDLAARLKIVQPTRSVDLASSDTLSKRGTSKEPERLSKVADRSLQGLSSTRTTIERMQRGRSHRAYAAKAGSWKADAATNGRIINGITSAILAHWDATAEVDGRSKYVWGARGQYWFVRRMIGTTANNNSMTYMLLYA